jgi:hypothetical protein
MREMDYFDRKPDLDMKSFYEGRGVVLSSTRGMAAGAPPPKDTYWVAEPENPGGDED